MTGKQALLDLLQREAGEAKSEILEQRQLAWIADVGQLMTRLAAFVADSSFEGKLETETGEQELVEDLGPYEIPTLTINFRTLGRKVKVLPRGSQVVGGIFTRADGREDRLVGASGRVDLVCGAGRVTLLRFIDHDGTTWRWLGREGELDENSFFEVLSQLVA
jgi:hypothetical protein